VSIIDPWFIAPGGLSNDDHPHADIRLGQAFLSDIVEAFTSSPCYERSALVVTYDEWGGFWDHVDPPRLPDDRATPADPGGADDFGQVGFRIPSVIVSPWTRTPSGQTGSVDHTVYDHASILRFITENWGLPYLNARHRGTNSIESAFGGFQSFDPTVSFTPYEAPLHLLLEPLLEDPIGQIEQVPFVGDLITELPHIPGLPAGTTERLLGPVSSLVQSSVSDLHRLADIGWFDKLPINIDLRFEDTFLHRRPALLAETLGALGL